MPELSASDSTQNEQILILCPMCGARVSPESVRCLECGEVLKSKPTLGLRNEDKLRSLNRALIAMHVIVGCSLILMGLLLYDDYFSLNFNRMQALELLFVSGSLLLAIGHLCVIPGVSRRQISALKASMWCSSLTALLFFATICLFMAGILMLAGVIQAHRVMTMIREQEKLAEAE